MENAVPNQTYRTVEKIDKEMGTSFHTLTAKKKKIVQCYANAKQLQNTHSNANKA